MAEPACYGLLFGSPVPGYQAPAEQTTGPGTRVIGQLVRIFQCAHQAGKLSPQKGLAEPSRAVPSGDFAAIRGGELSLTLDDAALTRGVLVWAALFGAVNFEVFGQYGEETFGNPAALFDAQLDILAQIAGFAGQWQHG
ncbi:TetR-like C-terminal domain-containing protein [Arthrobacter sp. AQ5-05]|uniref:TetR-like C-terminal domain-containing protein n=1 Tax=Arthrobacter sp. AQ5-05 TaxID=2184581 RepID=UPI0018A6ED22|nr:TetR-like C-terminal domain-containing protein [Arthrobacter sp. AQ5-05]